MRARFVVITAVLVLVALPRVACGQTPVSPVDTVYPDSGAAQQGQPRAMGTYLADVLSRLSHGDPVRLDIPIEVHRPGSLPAALYASRYGISLELARRIIDVAVAEGVDPELGFRLIRVESVFRTRARGPAGALGLTQLMPGTARSIDRSVRTEAQILEPTTNLRLGFRYLRRMIERYKGDVRLGVLAYNRGQTAVDRALRAGRDPENGYSRKVLGGVSGGGEPYRGIGLLSRGN